MNKEPPLQKYIVDLSYLTQEQREAMYQRLNAESFIAEPIVPRFNSVVVYWNQEKSIEEVVNIPSCYIRPYFANR